VAELTVDRLGDSPAPLQVLRIESFDIGEFGDPVREPHRHDYHELIWVRSGRGHHLLDGEPFEVAPGTVTLIGRGQIHQFEQAEGVAGAVVRFGNELVPGGDGEHADPAWLLTGRGGRSVTVPPGETERLDAVIDALAAEAARPVDEWSGELERHLLAVLLLWVERWYAGARGELRVQDDADTQLRRRFARVLEGDFARHHDAAHYADTLGVPPAALSKALARNTGRPTKELVIDRVMLEAARLLRFTDLTIGQIAHRTGFADQLYFSRAFKRHHGVAPSEFRARSRGR
jgi:AraC family transcriptional activator of pobA